MQDDDFAEVFEAIIGAEHQSSSDHRSTSVSAVPEMMAVLGRAGFVSRSNGNNSLSRKIGGPIVVARRAGQNFTFAQLLYWFMINDMIVPGSSYWNIAFGREAGEVANDAEGLATIDRFAEKFGLARQVRGKGNPSGHSGDRSVLREFPPP